MLGIRNTFARLAEELVKQNQPEKAIGVLNKCMEIMPHESVPFDVFTLRIITAYFNAGAMEKADEILAKYDNILQKERDYYASLSLSHSKVLEEEISENQYLLEQIGTIRRDMAIHP